LDLINKRIERMKELRKWMSSEVATKNLYI
jgi:hypothetical protein